VVDVLAEEALAVLDVFLRIEDVMVPELIQISCRREGGFGPVADRLQKTAVAKRDPVDLFDVPPFIHAGFERDRRQIEVCDIGVQSEQRTSPRSHCWRRVVSESLPHKKCITDDAFQLAWINARENESDSSTTLGVDRECQRELRNSADFGSASNSQAPDVRLLSWKDALDSVLGVVVY
jgi:hypothetical protein